MQISKITNYIPMNINFGRRLTPDEEVDYQKNAIKPAFDYLGTKEVAMIMHGTCFPQGERDIGVGTPYGKVAAQLIPFEMLHGFNSTQLGPVGELCSCYEVSPYKSSVATKNQLFIDFEKIATKEYGNLLTDDDIIPNMKENYNNGKNYAYSDFSKAFESSDILLKKAYNNFKNSLLECSEYENPELFRLKKEYDEFKQKNSEKLENAALFNVLKRINGTDDFTQWNYTDKNLKTKKRDEYADGRIEYLKNTYGVEMDIYCFGQFIIEKQMKENADLRKESGFKYISDMLVGVSKADEWANQDIFLKDFRMGCPYGGENNGMQKWDIPVLDPKQLFNKDGSLGEGGKYLKEKIEDALTNFDNVRIDHALGLVDPFIYSKDGTRSGNVSTMTNIDPDKNFEKVLNKIVLPVLEEHGIDKNSPVWEDLVTKTPVFERIYYQENNLPGITQLEYERAENHLGSGNWNLVGSHDSIPAQKMIKRDWARNSSAWDPMYLAGVLNAINSSNREQYLNKISYDDRERVKAKFAEMFMMGDKVQISFADFFGIDKTYNQGGIANPDNWKLRLNKDYEDTYYKNLSSDNPTAINMPEVLKLALQGKAEMDIAKGKPADEVWNETAKILYTLNKYAEILKEKE